MNIITNIKNRLIYPAAYAYVSLQSKWNWLKSLSKPDRVVFSTEYQGQNVLLFALFEKGTLRDDVRALLLAAKKQGAYVLCVNTLKLAQPEAYKDLMDCYIEKYNFGRDFGSYKSGFSYLYKAGIAKACPRLLLLNDSVFFSAKNNDAFLVEMFSSSCEVLGATENHEIEHHLGSFCIAFDGAVVRNAKFKKYWVSYSNSDIRPVVIKRGEMGLSKILRKIVSSPENFRALYDVTRAATCLDSDPSLLDEVAVLSRNSDLVGWRKFSFAAVSKSIVSKYLHNTCDLIGVSTVNADFDEFKGVDVHYAHSVSSFSGFICQSIVNHEVDHAEVKHAVRAEVVANFIACFAQGSQIHQNNIFLHRMGLPIVKLDALYRGMFSARDIENIAQDLEPNQAESFRWMMYSRPFGGDVLFGWKRAAFYRGLI